MGDTYTNKYNMVFHENANCTIINGAEYHAPVTFMAGQMKSLPTTSQTIKQSIEQLEADGILSTGTQWWAIYRVLVAKCNYPQNKMDFCKVIDKLNINVKTKCTYDNWRNVQVNHLNGSVDTWQALADNLSATENNMLRVAEALMRLLNIQ